MKHLVGKVIWGRWERYFPQSKLQSQRLMSLRQYRLQCLESEKKTSNCDSHRGLFEALCYLSAVRFVGRLYLILLVLSAVASGALDDKNPRMQLRVYRVALDNSTAVLS